MTKSTTISGFKFEISTPYSEGHTVTADEAAVLNQVRAENIGNNLRAKVKEQAEAVIAEAGGELTDVQTTNFVTQVQSKIIDAYDKDYKLEAKKPAQPRVTDPVEKEARKLATNALIDAIAGKFSVKSSIARKILKGEEVEGVSVAANTAEKLQEKLESLVVKGSKIWKTAEANVKKAQDATSGILDDLGLADAAE